MHVSENVYFWASKTSAEQPFSGASTCAFHCRYLHMVNTRYIPDLIYFFSKWPRLNRVNYGPKPKSLRWKMSTCGDGNFPLCRFFDEIFFRGFIFSLFQKNFFSSFSQSHSLASSLKCKLLFSSHTKVLLFRPHITRKKPKTFSMNIYFIKKKMLLLMLQSVCMLCYDVRIASFL